MELCKIEEKDKVMENLYAMFRIKEAVVCRGVWTIALGKIAPKLGLGFGLGLGLGANFPWGQLF